ncbi:MAG: GNVR domain-containing protein [Treponema phagedenis]|uniref:GNVR domain-containing protein n=1 Tax=Treponema phagedenis TaxID=162 RepID=UPI003133DBB8
MNTQMNIDEDEISLIDLFAVVWKFKWLITGMTAAAIVLIVGYSIVSKQLPPEKSFLPDRYTSAATMLIQENDGGNSALSKLAASGLGNLAGLAGINVGGAGDGYSKLALYLAGSDSFLDVIIDEFDLIDRYKVKKFPKTETRKLLKKHLKAGFDDKSGVFTLSFKDIDPVFAQRVVEFAVTYYEQRFSDMGLDKNKLEKESLEKSMLSALDEIKRLEREAAGLERRTIDAYGTVPAIALEATRLKREINVQEQIYGQLKARYELLKIEMASDTPVFQVLDYPQVPEQKSEPSRGKLCIIVTFAAFFFSVLLAFLLNAVSAIRQDPAAMARLKGER